MGQVESSSAELEDLSFENGRRKLFTDDELRRGRSNNNISWKKTNKQTNKEITYKLPDNMRWVYGSIGKRKKKKKKKEKKEILSIYTIANH